MSKEERESSAFLAWITAFELSRPVSSLADLSDGAALFDILSVVDAEYFRAPVRPSAQPSENWVLRFNSLKRLYRLMTQYFAEVLNQPDASSLDVPDLQSIAKDHTTSEILRLCRLTIAIAVQSQKAPDVVKKIQDLKESDQAALMRAIEQVMLKLGSGSSSSHRPEASMTDDDHFYHIQSERSKIFTEKETLEKVYQSLLEEHRTLQTSFDDLTLEKDDLSSQLRDMRRQADDRRNDRADAYMKAEIDRLKTELQKSEDNLGMAENELDKQMTVAAEMSRKVDELQAKANEAVRLKDQLDEYRHAADKLQKTENVMEKYKKKLEESADLRRTVKALEEQNATLVDKNASLEEEYRKVAGFKPLMESYKQQIADLEAKGSEKQKQMETLKFELDQSKTKLKMTLEERAKDAEALELYQERVKELELRSVSRPQAKSASSGTPVVAESMQDLVESDLRKVDEETEDDMLVDNAAGLGGELDDAITGTTMTDLKLQVRKLQRELEAAKSNQAEASKVLVLENLLEDANRMKTRYEADYLAAHREKLVLQNELEEIRSGKALGDGPEAAIALRQRLNETVDQLDALQRKYAELEVKCETMERDLTIAKSDLNLVNKDQLEILASLRESVNEDKAGLEADITKLQEQLRELKDKNKMQLEQINGLLMEKVTLQGESIGQREKMLERERIFGDLRASLNGKDLPEDAKARLLAMHEDNMQLKEQLNLTQEKLQKARQFIKNQDKLFKDEAKSRMEQLSSISLEEAESVLRSQIKVLEDDLARQKRITQENQARYLQEQELMLGALHEVSMKVMRDHFGGSQRQQAPPRSPSSWLGQRRHAMGQGLAR
ncbi:hypothetical protein FRC02_000779 [Tulasnella sp. 418]|nr:hypothetical protein FRC02_000779 [Tulasnella sp. 418]